MKYILIIVAFFICNKTYSQLADSADSRWRHVATSVNEDKWYVSTKKPIKTYEGKSIWVKVKMNSVTFNKKVYTNVFRLEFFITNCESQMYKVTKSVLYNSNGDVIDSYDSRGALMEQVVPDSVMEKVMEEVCNRE